MVERNPSGYNPLVHIITDLPHTLNEANDIQTTKVGQCPGHNHPGHSPAGQIPGHYPPDITPDMTYSPWIGYYKAGNIKRITAEFTCSDIHKYGKHYYSYNTIRQLIPIYSTKRKHITNHPEIITSN